MSAAGKISIHPSTRVRGATPRLLLARAKNRLRASFSRVCVWRQGRDKGRQAIAALGRGELSDLSEAGLKIWREERHKRTYASRS
jgi:hypothetical protein